MKKIILSLLFLSTLTIFSCKKESTAQGEENATVIDSKKQEGTEVYGVNTSESIINWTGSKPTGKHSGTIALKDGEIGVSDGKIVSGKFTLDINSITVTDLKPGDGKEDLESHLKGTGDKKEQDHFFNVKKYPTGMFVINKVEFENEKTIVYGNLSLKNVTKAVNFPANISITDSLVTLESEPLMINRTYWHINYGSKSIFSDLKDKFVNDDVEIMVNVKATKK